jgi:hypothetical protein
MIKNITKKIRNNLQCFLIPKARLFRTLAIRASIAFIISTQSSLLSFTKRSNRSRWFMNCCTAAAFTATNVASEKKQKNSLRKQKKIYIADLRKLLFIEEKLELETSPFGSLEELV